MLTLWIGLLGCTPTGTEGSAGPQEGPKEEDRIQILSTNYPSHALALRLAPPGTEMRCLLPPGQSAAHWKPSPEQISELGEADLILAQGMGYEKWLELASLPSDRLVLMAEGIEPVKVEVKTHSHGEDGEHSHGESASHTWMDPHSFKDQAQRLAEAIIEADSEAEEEVQNRLEKLLKDLDALDQDWAELMGELGEAQILVSQPFLSYLTRRHGQEFKQHDWDPLKRPSPHTLSHLPAAREDALSLILWRVQPGPGVRESFPRAWTHLILDPLEQAAEGKPYDYFEQTRANQQQLRLLLHPEEAAAEEEREAPPSDGEGERAKAKAPPG